MAKFHVFPRWYCDDVRNHPSGYFASTRPLDDMDGKPRCRCCGQRLEPGETVIAWLHDPGGALHWRYNAFIHPTC